MDLLGPVPRVRVIDFEATGLEPDAAIVEVGHYDVSSQGDMLGGASYLCRVDHMPPDTRAVHHIRASDTAGQPPYDRRCLYEQAVRDGVVLWAAHNASFEERHMVGDIRMICTDKAARRYFTEAPGYSVFALLYWLEDTGRATYDGFMAYPPHRAGPDSYATAVILSTMLREGVTARDLMQWTREPRFMKLCPIGQWRNKPWDVCDFGFLRWILDKVDDPDIRWNAARELDRRSEQND